MAVVDFKETESRNTSGFKKQIEESASAMIMDNLQVFMYQKPIQSTVRECVSNAIDSVTEKVMAQSILRGESKVEDYYVEKDGDIYRDSKFDTNYYDLKHMSALDKVEIKYVNGAITDRDKFIITDYGVGLGGKRLVGYFSLGYSSKRLSLKTLGSFGLGAKSPLSTGVESFRILTIYNGKEMCFDVYSHKVDCVYGKWNEDGSENEYEEFFFKESHTDDEGVQTLVDASVKFYYIKTVEKNRTSVMIDVKKHNKHQYMEAVKSQLMYIQDQVFFTEEYSKDHPNSHYPPHEVQFKAKILYEDDNLMLSDYNQYNRPHFVIKNVTYGIIDFTELELPVRYGNIGIKVKMEDIDVTPSRESVVYSLKTRATILEKYKLLSDVVLKSINESLKEKDIVLWMRACNDVMFNRGDDSSVMGKLANLIDRSELAPVFDGTIKYSSTLSSVISPLLSMQHIHTENEYDYKLGKRVTRVKRNESKDITGFSKNLYFQFVDSKNRTTKYLLEKNSQGGYIVIRSTSNFFEEFFNEYVNNKFLTDADALKAAYDIIDKEYQGDAKRKDTKDAIDKALQIVRLLKESNYVGKYDHDAVPAEYAAVEEGDDSVEEVDTYEQDREAAYKKVLEARKAAGKFIAHLVYTQNMGSKMWDKQEIDSNDLDFEKCQIVYGYEEDNEYFKLFRRMESIVGTPNSYCGWTDKVKVVRIAKNNKRYVKAGIHISKFLFSTDNDGVFTVWPALKEIFTSVFMRKLSIHNVDFLTNFGMFDKTSTKTFNEVINYVKRRSINDIAAELKSHPAKQLLAAYDLQNRLLQDPTLSTDDALRFAIYHKYLPDEDVLSTDLIDMDMYNKALQVADLGKVYGSVLNHISPLTHVSRGDLNSDLEYEIREIILKKKDQLEFKYPNLLK